jgi:hypothetical protein
MSDHEPKGIANGLTRQELVIIPTFRMESQKKENAKHFSHNIIILGGM